LTPNVNAGRGHGRPNSPGTNNDEHV